MKLQHIILLVSVLLLNSVISAQDVDVTNPKIEKVGDSLIISFDAKIAEISTNDMLALTPVLWNNSKEFSLPQIIVVGRNKTIMQERKEVVMLGYFVDNTNTITSYKVSVPFELWMEEVSLRMHKMLEGCCEAKMIPTIVIINNKLKPLLLPLTPQFRDLKEVYLSDFKEDIKDYTFVSHIGDEVEPEGLDIYFELDRYLVKESFMDNKTSIRKIREAIQFIKSSQNMELTRISIVGGASPEGTVLHNKKLGNNRAMSVINYFSKDIDPNIFIVENIGENWDGLYSMVESSDMKYRDEVLSIIDNTPINEGREEQLMKLRRGRPYKYLLKEFFPELRRTSYLQVFYDIKPDDGYTEITKSLALMKINNYKEALGILLLEVDETSYTNNLIGVCYMMMEDVVNAKFYLQRAIDGGDNDAKKNLEQLNNQIDNIQYK